VDQSTVIVPSLSYVDDNTLWGFIAPSTGRRFNFGALASPGLFDDSPVFWSVTGDYRLYTRLGPRYTLVFRLAGGGSFGPNPQKFIIGGVEGWIAPVYQTNSFPVQSADDYLFMTTGVPVRGYYYDARHGTKYGLMNIELRFPLFAYLTAGPLPLFFQTLNGTLFFDAATTWTNNSDLRISRRTPTGAVVTSDLLQGMGYGVRAVVLGFLLKLDVAWAFNWQRFSTPIYYFSIGQDI
jgi:outer membrane protein assembly factor BamA